MSSTLITKTVASIVEELIAIQGVPAHTLTQDEKFQFPRMIGVGGGRVLYINAKIDALIDLLCLEIYQHNSQFKQSTSLADFGPIIRSSIGVALAAIDLDDPVEQLAATVVSDVLSSASAEWEERSGPQEHCFGCVLFGFSVHPFEIGPVKFETRGDWLTRRFVAREVSEVTASRLRRAWNGEKLRKRKPSSDSLNERDILDLVGTCGYVVSVRTNRLTQGFARERALVAARIALMAIALLWQTPSKRLSGFNIAFDREMRFRTSMAVIRGQLLTSRSKVNISVDGSFRDEDWNAVLRSSASHFKLYAELIETTLSPITERSRDTTLRRLFHATLWFHEAAREISPLIATLKFAASMDALASGGREGGILTLFEKVLSWKRDVSIFSDGTTLKAAISQIYGQGRSRTIHGNNDQIAADWSTISARAEQLAKCLLMACVEWAAQRDRHSDIAVLTKRMPKRGNA